MPTTKQSGMTGKEAAMPPKEGTASTRESDSRKLDEIFRMHDEAQRERAMSRSRTLPGADVPASGATSASRKLDEIRVGTSRLTRDEQAWADAGAAEAAEADARPVWHPVQRRDDTRLGCAGGILYAVFIICVSVILACLGWMAASDMLGLNKEDFTATVVLPEEIFTSEVVEQLDDEGNVVDRSTVRRADLHYLSSTLKNAGIIEYPWLFEAFCRFSHADEKVRPGEYKLQSGCDYRALVQGMRPNASGASTVNVTLIEGMTMREMFITLERSGVASYEDLTAAAKTAVFNYPFLSNPSEETPELDATRLEGFLFPETYNFYTNMQASSAINRLLDQFNTKLTEEVLTRVQESGRSLRDIVTVASMIEKEAADDDERGLVASVIYNRLHADMVLGIDATILYAHPEHEGAPTAEMLREHSPYNTRRNRGLPPTPICNPGLASLIAALNPETTDYLYYALDTETGRHRFFTDEASFNAFVATQDY